MNGRATILALILVAVTVLAFLPAMKGDFVFDDLHLVRDSPITQAPGFLRSFLWQAFGDPLEKRGHGGENDAGARFYRPLVSLSFWLDFKMWGLNAAGFHLTNILVHVFNVLLLFLLVFRLAGDAFSAGASALLFSVFPTHFENVAWISGRTDLLALLFLLMSAHFFLSHLEGEKRRSLLPAAFFFFLALLSKEAVALSLVAFAGAFWLQRRKAARPSWRGFILSFSLALLLYLFLRQAIVGSPSLTFATLPPASLFSGLGFYLARMAFPFFIGLSVPDERILDSAAYLSLGIAFCLLLFMVSGYFIIKKRYLPPDLLLALLVLLLLLPSLFTLFFDNPILPLAWRFLYLPLAAALPLLAVSLARFFRPPLLLPLAAALALLYGAELLPHVRHYGQGERGFWLHLHSPQRESRLFRLNHAASLLPASEKQALAILDSLIRDRSSHFAEFFRRRAMEVEAFYYTSADQLAEARLCFERLFAEFPDQPLSVHFQYAGFLAKSGKQEEGRRIVSDYLRRYPENHQVLLHGADFFLLTGDYPRALELLRRDFRLYPIPAVRKKIEKLQGRPLID